MVADQFFTKSHGLEELATVVTGEHRDAHLGHDLEEALVDSLPVRRDNLGGVHVRQSPLRLPAGGQFPDEVGADSRGAEADETGKMVDVAAVAGLGDEGDTHAETAPDEGVMDGGDGQEHGQGGLFG